MSTPSILKMYVGQKFGLLTVKELGVKTETKKGLGVLVVCTCGKETVVLPNDLMRGCRKTCGSPKCSKASRNIAWAKRLGDKPKRARTREEIREERELFVRNHLPVKDYTAGCFEGLSDEQRGEETA